MFSEFVKSAYQQYMHFERPQVKIDYGKHTFQFVISKKSIDMKTKRSPSFEIFKKKYTAALFQSQ